ncbi:MAG: hypothetical protein ACKVQK_05965 [Burkholderiales bacterium]
MKATLAAYVESLGVAGVAGIGLAAFALAFYFGSVRPAEPRLAELQKEQARLEQAQSQRTRQGAPAVEISGDEKLTSFYELLATKDSISKNLEAVDAIAKQNGVVLRQGSYKLLIESGARLGRYEIAYTGQAAYFQARLFLRDVLRQLPMIALDEVDFQRQQTGSGATEISARFSLLVDAMR